MVNTVLIHHCCRGTSSKTRTATYDGPQKRDAKRGLQRDFQQNKDCNCHQVNTICLSHVVAEGLPAKQGLQREVVPVDSIDPVGCRGTSSKTRTATIIRKKASLLSTELQRDFQQNKDCNRSLCPFSFVTRRLQRDFQQNKDCNTTFHHSSSSLPSLQRDFQQNKDCNCIFLM